MRTRRCFATLLSAGILLLGCQQEPNLVATTTPPVPPPATTTAHPTTTVTASLTVEPTVDAHVRENCPVLGSSAPADATPSGHLILKSLEAAGFTLKSLDLQSGIEYELTRPEDEKTGGGFSVSPDRTRLAWVANRRDPALIISDALGNRTDIGSSSQLHGAHLSWVNNERLSFLVGEEMTVLDPSTGEQEIYLLDEFPNIYLDDPRKIWPVLDPSLQRSTYRTRALTTALGDLTSKQILAEIPERFDRAPVVAWSPDGSLVAIVGAEAAEEIFFVNRDGQEMREVTHLGDIYDGDSYNLYNLAWSPDGLHLAFWQTADSPRLFVLDTKTGELTNYCTFGKVGGQAFYGPIWSPDGSQLLVEQQADEDTINSVVIDLARNVAFKVAENMIPVGWMK